MHYQIKPITRGAAEDIVQWRYPEPFAIYNLTGADVDAEVHYFLDPGNHFHVVSDQNGALIGFCSFGLDAQAPGGDYADEALDIGLGLRPDLTGQGLGAAFLAAILDFANQTFAPHRLRATIARFNNPSRRIFEKNGFHIVQTFISQSDPPIRFDILMRPARMVASHQ